MPGFSIHFIKKAIAFLIKHSNRRVQRYYKPEYPFRKVTFFDTSLIHSLAIKV